MKNTTEKVTSTALFTIGFGENKSFTVNTRDATCVVLGLGCLALAKSNEELLSHCIKSLYDYGVDVIPNVSSMHMIFRNAWDITKVAAKVVAAAMILPFMIKGIGLLAQFVGTLARGIISITEKVSNWMLNGILNEKNEVLMQYATKAILMYALMLTVLIPARMHNAL